MFINLNNLMRNRNEARKREYDTSKKLQMTRNNKEASRNEKYVAKVIDDLMKIGAEVVYSSLEAIHVSGHACQEEQKLKRKIKEALKKKN